MKMVEKISMGGGLKKPLVLKVFSTNREKQRPGTFAILALRLYMSYNQAHVPGQHMWPIGILPR